jgi:large subunit ribosomal protein L9
MAQVKLILRESVSSLGEAGDVVSVKPGYAKNFLIPQGKATFATESNVRELEHQQRVVAEKVTKELDELGAVRSRIESLALEVKAKVGEEGKLFGSVTALQIRDLLAEQGIEVDRRRIGLDEPIKEAGEHSVAVKLHRDLVAQLKLTVAAEE